MKKFLCILLVLCMVLPMSACGIVEEGLPSFDIGGLFEDVLSPVRDLADSIGGFFDGLFSQKAKEDAAGFATEPVPGPGNPPLIYDTEEAVTPDDTEAPSADTGPVETEGPADTEPAVTEAPADTEAPAETEPEPEFSLVITVTEVEIIPPKGGTYELVYAPEQGMDITVAGPQRAVKDLTAADLRLRLDLSPYPTATAGTVQVPLQVTLREGVSPTVRVSGNYSIAVRFNVQPVLYLYTGHGSASLPAGLTDRIFAEGVSVRETDSLTGVPVSNSAVLLLYDLKEDLTEAESDTLTGYLYRGGRILLVTDYRRCGGEKQDMPYLAAVTKAMGLTAEAGLVVEVSRGHYYAAPHMLLPALAGNGPAKKFTATRNLFLMTNAHGIRLESNATAQTESLLQTSELAFLKETITVSGFYTKSPGDPEGIFHVAATAQLGEARMVWFASPSVLKEQENTISQDGNHQLFLASLFWAMGK